MTDHPLDGRIERLSLMLDLDTEIQQGLIASLKEVGRVAGMNKGDQLFGEGESTDDDGYVVISGSLIVEGSSGFRNVMSAPSLVGEMKQFAFGGDETRVANVTAAEDLEVLHFDWNALYESLGTHVNADELEAFRCALRRYAWMHFLELEGEL
jgi:CRP-like cAMP-binding protein